MSHPAMVQPGEHLQRLQRTGREFTDQHGRKFFAWADKASNQPIGEFQPMGFQPPWLPPMRYAQFRRDGDLHFVWQYETLATEYADAAQRYYQEAITMAMEKNITNRDGSEIEIGGPVPMKIRIVLGKPPLSPAIPLACAQGDPWLLGVPGAAVNEVLREILYQGTGSNNRAALDMIRTSLAAKMAGMRDAGQLVPTVAQPKDESAKPARSIHTVDEHAALAMMDVTWQQFAAQLGGKGMAPAEIAALWRDHKAEVKKLKAERAKGERQAVPVGAGA